MKLFALAALVAVCGAAKLDRTYLPPASASTAGGSPGFLQAPLASAKASASLQSPFAGNSLNNGAGGLPKGSYTNEFQGVVVDAALAGTRATGETGLGAPRISYGSADSKVGGAAFRVKHPSTGFNQPQGSQAGFTQHQGSQPGLNQPPRYRPTINKAYGTQQGFNQPQGAQSSFTQPQRAQSSFTQPQGAQPTFNQGFQPTFNQGSQSTYNQPQNSPTNQPDSNQPERPQAPFDRAANTVKLVNDVGPENYNFAFETDNGIVAEERGVATNDGVMAEGGYSYTGDDGQTYAVTYVADENGYQPKGDHLPTPPPIPEEILKSLEQNARDEAAGVVDDGMYDSKKYNMGGDYAPDNNDDGKYTHQSGFGDGSVTDSGSSGSYNNQNRRPFGKPNQTGLSSTQNGGNTLGYNAKPAKFNHQGQRPYGSSSQQIGPKSPNSAQVGQNTHGFSNTASSLSSFGQNDKPGKFNHQSARPGAFGQSSSPSGTELQYSGQFGQNSASAFASTQDGVNAFGQNAKPGKFDHQGTKPSSFGQSSPTSGPKSQYPGQFGQHSASAFASTQDGVSTFGQNAKPGKFDHQTIRPSAFGQSSQPSGPKSQYPGQFDLNSASAYANTQDGVNKFGQNAKPGKFDHQGTKPSLFGQSSPTSGSKSQYPGQFGQHSASAFASTQDGVSTFGQNAKPGKFDHQTIRPSAFGQSNPPSGPDSQYPGQFGQNSASAYASTQDGVNTFGQIAKPGNFNYQGSVSTGFETSNQLTGTGSQNEIGISGIKNEFIPQANNAVSQPTRIPGQTEVSPSSSNPNYGSEFSNSFQGFGNKQQYFPTVNNANGQQITQSTQSRPQNKPQSRPQDSGSSESSSSEENSSEEDDSTSNQPQQTPQKPSYLPPFPQKPNQNEPIQPSNPQYNGNKHDSGFQSPFPKPQQNQGPPLSSYPSPAPSDLPPESQPAFEPQQFDYLQTAQTEQPNLQNANGPFPSQQTGQFVQNNAFGYSNEAQFGHQSQSSTSTSFTPEPDTGLTTPLQSTDSFPGTGHTSSSETSPNKPSQPQFGSQSNNGQYTSPASSSSSTPAFEVQPTSASSPESLPFGNQYQASQFGYVSPQYQSQYSQNGQDSQFSPSTQRPNYGQQTVSDDSYIYNQPSQSFINQGSGFPTQVPSFPNQDSSYPSTPSSQFEKETQSPAYPTDRYPNALENSPSPTVQYSPQGPINYPNPPTLPSASPTSSTQYQGNTVSGITQAAISSFPSVSPTQASLNTQSPFQSRPGFQQTTTQFNQGSPQSRPAFGPVSSTVAPLIVPQGQTEDHVFNQESSHSVEDASETPLPTQQYQGELYDYSKPAQLPPAPENDGQPGAGQFGVTNSEQDTAQPDNEGSQSTIAPQFGFQDTEKPQYGAEPSRPSSQSTFSPEGTTVQPDEPSIDYSASQLSSKPSRPQNNENENRPSSPYSQSRPQFGAQSNSFSQTPENPVNIEPQEKPTQAPFGLRPCCQGSSRFGQNKKPGSQNKFPFQQGSGFAAQSTPSRPTMNSFVGQGETFDASRKPPRFDENGYHY